MIIWSTVRGTPVILRHYLDTDRIHFSFLWLFSDSTFFSMSFNSSNQVHNMNSSYCTLFFFCGACSFSLFALFSIGCVFCDKIKPYFHCGAWNQETKSALIRYRRPSIYHARPNRNLYKARPENAIFLFGTEKGEWPYLNLINFRVRFRLFPGLGASMEALDFDGKQS